MSKSTRSKAGHSGRYSSPEIRRAREEALRPCSILGYDHETLALYLVERGAYRLAEKELQRAVWLNPFEPRFKKNLEMVQIQINSKIDSR